MNLPRPPQSVQGLNFRLGHFAARHKPETRKNAKFAGLCNALVNLAGIGLKPRLNGQISLGARPSLSQSVTGMLL